MDAVEDLRAGGQPFLHTSEILDGLYVGPYAARADVERLSIQCVLSIMTADERTELSGYRTVLPDGISEAKLVLDDGPFAELNLTLLLNAVSYIHSWRTARMRVLVHCQAGISRSVSMVIAYLLARGVAPTARDALRLVRKRRACAAPNKNFMKNLGELQDTLRELCM